MARIRSIKPEIRTSEKVTSWPIEVRYFWVLLWGYCDDHGKGRDNSRLIRADTFPLDDDVSVEIVDRWMDLLEREGVIERYSIDDKAYFRVVNWREHQKPSHPSRSVIPDPPEGLANDSRHIREPVARDAETRSPEQGAGSRERGDAPDGAEPPSRFCPRHPNGSSDPCGPCADARYIHDAWQKTHARSTSDARLQRDRVETDIRVAKTLGFLEQDAPNDSIPPEVVARLADYRAKQNLAVA